MTRAGTAHHETERDVDVRVTSVRRVSAGVVSLELRDATGSALPPWRPGAHVELDLAPGTVRQYSLCGDPADDHVWRVAVLREPDGRGGSRLVHDELEEGDVLAARGPRNNFELTDDAEEYLFIAGGIGITPILAMVRAADDRSRPWTLVYGGRSRDSMAFLGELEEPQGGAVHLVPEDECGLIDLDRFLGDPSAGTAVYCCGPGPLLGAVEQQCMFWPTGALHTERFAPRDVSRLDGGFEVELARSGTRLCVPPDSSLLDILESEGYEVTYSCRAGICGTCLLDVVDGVPEHNDDVLTDAERDSNEIILPCVSRSRTDLLVLDL